MTYVLSTRLYPGLLEIEAVGYAGRERLSWIECWPDGWVAQEATTTGGGVIAERLPTREDALDAVIDFLTEYGGHARIEFDIEGAL